MGCDIHTYIEFAECTTREGEPYWSNFTRNGGSRNYTLFGVLAGVRVSDAKLYGPKGMPEGQLGWDTAEDYWLNVAPDDHPEWADQDTWTSRELAERWVQEGSSIADLDEDGRLRRVSGPDYHSHSWLTSDELEQALQHYTTVTAGRWPGEDASVPAEWQAMLCAMRTFEAAGKQTRIVFWFDN